MACGCKKTGRFAPAQRNAAASKPASGAPKVWTGSKPAAVQGDAGK